MATRYPASPAAQSQAHDTGLQIVLIGTSGSGKSATGNTIIGEKKFKSFTSDQSVTLKCQRATGLVDGTKIAVIDTPGFHCTKLSNEEVITQLKKVNDVLEGLYAFLLVIPVGPPTPKELITVSLLQEALGESYLSNTVIVFSQSDNLEFTTREDFIKEHSREIQELVYKCGFRYHFINNRAGWSGDETRRLISDLKRVAKRREEPKPQFHPADGSWRQQQQVTGRNEVPMMGRNEVPMAGRNEVPMMGRNEVPMMGRNEVPMAGRNEVPMMGRNEVPMAGRSKIPMTGKNEVHMTKEQLSEVLANTRFMVLGIKGVGKTTTINNILPSAAPSKQDGCLVYRDEQKTMVECPGFDENLHEIKEAVQRGLRLCAPGPHVIVVVMKVDRFGPATKRTMQRVQGVLGSEARKHVIVLFTRRDDLEGRSIQEYISESQDLLNCVHTFGGRCFSLENRGPSTQIQVMELLNMIGEMLLNNKGDVYKGQ